MNKLPIRHLSVRVPWHDRGWNGQICENPRNNASCMFLQRIQEKNVDWEEQNSESWLHDLEPDKLPPCVDEKVCFMSEHSITKTKPHPYSESEELYKHFKEGILNFAPFSFSVVPFRWMLKNPETKESEVAKEYGLDYDPQKEPKLGFTDTWVQHHENQKVLLDTFISAIQKEKSLVFIYAKNIPLVQNVTRVLIGVGRIKDFTDLHQYNYSVTNPPFRCFLWERTIYHSIRPDFKDGFLLPYQEIIERINKDDKLNPEDYIAYAPSFDEFSFGSEHVSHGTAIDSLLALRKALTNCGEILKRNYEQQLNWINDRISEIWNMRGAFPGIGSVLSGMEVPEGNILGLQIEKYLYDKEGESPKTNPWNIVEDVFKNKATYLPDEPQNLIGDILKKVFQRITENNKKYEYVKLLSRMEISNDQAKRFLVSDDFEQFLINPYLFYEISHLDAEPIEFGIVDKMIYPKKEIAKAFPLNLTQPIIETIDKRRIRSLCINILESKANEGHTLIPKNQLITEITNYKLEPACKVTIDIMDVIEEVFIENDKEIIKIIPKSDNSPCFYKLGRLQELKEIISSFVIKRVEKGKRHELNIDWHNIIENEFGPIDNNYSNPKKEKEARFEKAAALDELSKSRLSVLIGPAGTGKTTVLNLFCKLPDIKNKKILRLAPTGKARIKLGADAKTVAQFLIEYQRYEPETGRYFPNPEGKNYSESRTVIIDEASMLTEDQLAAILDCVIDVDRFILVGDHRQLPPIGVGKPFVDIINKIKPSHFDAGKPLVGHAYAELQVVCRQSKEDDSKKERIDIRLSKWFSDSLIRKEDNDIFDEISMKEDKDWGYLKFSKWHSPTELEKAILLELKSELNLKDDKDQIQFDISLGASLSGNYTYFNADEAEQAENWQILSPIRPYGYGVKELNRFIHNNFKEHVIEISINPGQYIDKNGQKRRKKRFFPKPAGIDEMVYGDKVINLSNTRWNKWYNRIFPSNKKDESLQYIANGEIGMITGCIMKDWDTKKSPRPIHVSFSSQPGYSYVFNPNDFEKEDGKIQIELAYAITIHKSQGSGFKKVFLILPNPCGLLSRELLYTALTRQEDRLIIFHQGDFKDFKKFISDEFSDSGRRLTDLFYLPSIREINKKHYDSKYVQVSAKGEFMISKSEVIIADHLFHNKIPYTYENKVTDDRGIVITPDFTIEDKEIGITYYWEHLGLLVKDDYRSKWELKKEWYEHYGVVPYDKATPENDKILITTRDKPDGGIDSKEILELIKKVFKN